MINSFLHVFSAQWQRRTRYGLFSLKRMGWAETPNLIYVRPMRMHRAAWNTLRALCDEANNWHMFCPLVRLFWQFTTHHLGLCQTRPPNGRTNVTKPRKNWPQPPFWYLDTYCAPYFFYTALWAYVTQGNLLNLIKIISCILEAFMQIFFCDILCHRQDVRESIIKSII